MDMLAINTTVISCNDFSIENPVSLRMNTALTREYATPIAIEIFNPFFISARPVFDLNICPRSEGFSSSPILA